MSKDLVPSPGGAISKKPNAGGHNKGKPKYTLQSSAGVVKNVERRLRRLREKRGYIVDGVRIRDLTPEESSCITADPLEVLISLAGGYDPLHPEDEVSQAVRMDAAKSAAQYTRAKVTEITGAGGEPLNLAPTFVDIALIMRDPAARKQMQDLQLSIAAAKRLEAGGTLKSQPIAEVVGVEFVKDDNGTTPDQRFDSNNPG